LWPGVKLAVEEAFGNGAKIHIISQNKDYKMSASYWHVRLP
jgi:hypothetical protein